MPLHWKPPRVHLTQVIIRNIFKVVRRCLTQIHYDTVEKKKNIVGIMSESNYLLLVIPKSRSSFTIIQVLQGISEPIQIGLSNSFKKQQREKLRERERDNMRREESGQTEILEAITRLNVQKSINHQ